MEVSPPPPLRLIGKYCLSKIPRPKRTKIIRWAPSSLQRTNISKLGGNTIFRPLSLPLSNYLLYIMGFRRSDEGRVAGLMGVQCEKGNKLYRELTWFRPWSRSWDTMLSGLLTLAGVTGKFCDRGDVCNHTEASATKGRRVSGTSYLTPILHFSPHRELNLEHFFFFLITKHDNIFLHLTFLGSVVKLI